MLAARKSFISLVACIAVFAAGCSNQADSPPPTNAPGTVTIVGLKAPQSETDVSVNWASAPNYIKQCTAPGLVTQSEYQRNCTLPYIHGMWNSSAGLLRKHSDLVKSAQDWLLKKPADGLWPIYYPSQVPAAKNDIDAIVAKSRAAANVRVRGLSNPLPIPGTPSGEIYQHAGLLFLPNSYVVPGGIFQEQYGWDSYFIIEGLLASAEIILKNPNVRYFNPATQRFVQLNDQTGPAYASELFQLAKGMADNHAFEIKYYGGMVNNGNRIYYLTRSQPPLFAHEALKIYDFAQKYPEVSPYVETLAPYFGGAAPTSYDEWVAREIAPLSREYFDYYTDPNHLIFNEKSNPRVVTVDGKQLSLYVTDGVGPVPEITDSQVVGNDGFYRNMAEYFRTHPQANPGQMFWRPNPGGPTAQLTQTYYRSDRATRASGYDLSGRFGYAGEWSAMFAPIDLQALLYQFAIDQNRLVSIAKNTGASESLSVPQTQIESMKEAIRSLLWVSNGSGRWTDKFIGPGPTQPTPYLYATTLIPLWAQGLATDEEASAVIKTATSAEPVDQEQLKFHGPTPALKTSSILESQDGKIVDCPNEAVKCVPKVIQTVPPAALLDPGNYGVPTSLKMTGNQWDYANAWAPIQDFASAGLRDHGGQDQAQSVDAGWVNAVDTGFSDTALLVEKYVVTNPHRHPPVTAGYSTNQAGFGWTNAFYLDAWQRQNGQSDEEK